MAKFNVDVEEIIRYCIEVEANSAEEASAKAEELFFAERIEDRCKKWEYMGNVEFEEPVDAAL
jgi:hypothetical protein